jgi:hypothetical protein
MTFIVDGTNGLTFPNSTVQASAGSVLQVVYATTTTATTTTANSYIATALTASIAPKFSTSKIFIIVSGTSYGSATGTQTTLKLYKNGSDISGIMAQIYGGGSTVEAQANFSTMDTPSTTSSTTYTVYMANTTATGTAYFPNGSSATMILMEIAA